MSLRHLVFLGLLVAALLMAACGPKATLEPTAAPQPTSTPLPPTDTPAPTATTRVLIPTIGEGEKVPMGFTEEGFPYRGHPDAPVTLLEYSDYQ